MKLAWVENTVIRDVTQSIPSEIYHPDIAANYTVQVPDDAEHGDTFDNGVLTKRPVPVPPEPPIIVPPIDPVSWLIDIGPFYDRFGAAKTAVLTSADAGVKAIMSDVSIRKWIDLQRADVAQSLAYIGSKVASVTPALQTAILTTPVLPEENLALRKLYFS
jgi:hypothetical protein